MSKYVISAILTSCQTTAMRYVEVRNGILDRISIVKNGKDDNVR